jgi:hypothetical protein
LYDTTIFFAFEAAVFVAFSALRLRGAAFFIAFLVVFFSVVMEMYIKR